MQNVHVLTHLFSLQQRRSSSHEENHTNDHFHGDHEQLLGPKLLLLLSLSQVRSNYFPKKCLCRSATCKSMKME